MPKINDQTLVDWLVEYKSYNPEEAWMVANKLLEKDREAKEPQAPKKRTEWLVIASDPSGRINNNVICFVVNKKPICKDDNLNDTTEERMWGDEEAVNILTEAFARVKTKGAPTFVSCLHAAKKLLKEEYGMEIKTKEGCYLAPIKPVDCLPPAEEDPDEYL